MNKKKLTSLCSDEHKCYCKILEHNADGITFSVDEGLSKPRKHLKSRDVNSIVKFFLEKRDIDAKTADLITSSFNNCALALLGEDTLFQTILTCFAEHRPLILSPDMIWMAINQGLADHFQLYSTRYRSKIVKHKGKIDLVVMSPTNLLCDDTDWPMLLNDFYSQIEQHTLNNIAPTMVCDFSTTKQSERIASITTLMTGLRTFFNYEIHHMICGIPQITILGNSEDWKKVADKATILKSFGLAKWYSWLEPILNEFIATAEGKPNAKFWKSIVMTLPSDEFYLKPERQGCLPPEPTYIDGWFLALFPSTSDGSYNFSKHNKDISADSEIKRVGITFKLLDEFGNVLEQHPLELWSGFIGVEEDKSSFSLKPKIGWFVRKSHQEDELIKALKSELKAKNSIHIDAGDINIPILRKIGKIPTLIINTYNCYNVSIPKELNDINIIRLIIQGHFSQEEEQELKSNFPNVEISNWT